MRWTRPPAVAALIGAVWYGKAAPFSIGGGSVNNVTTLGIDLAKTVFQLQGIDARGHVLIRKQVRRGELLATIARLPPCLQVWRLVRVLTIGRGSFGALATTSG